jgi:ribose transport system permease protein
MGSIGWLASSVMGTSKSLQPLLIAVVSSGVLFLAGMTNLPSTSIPMPLLILIACTIIASIFLNQTIFGRYLLALGRNEEAARYSGINTDRMVILSYVICSGMAGLGAILFALDINNLQPVSHGNIYELYAIAAAVLGGCSLRGGEGSIVGVIIGAAVMRAIYNSINTLGIDTKLEWFVLGIVILIGVVADEMVKRVVAAKRAKLQTQD